MPKEPKPIDLLLLDIVNWGEQIRSFVSDLSYEDFAKSRLHQLAVVKCIEAIGEAAGSIRRHYPDFVTANPNLELEAAYRARNRLSHGYDTIDMTIVWPAATISVPELVGQIRALASSE